VTACSAPRVGTLLPSSSLHLPAWPKFLLLRSGCPFLPSRSFAENRGLSSLFRTTRRSQRCWRSRRGPQYRGHADNPIRKAGYQPYNSIRRLRNQCGTGSGFRTRFGKCDGYQRIGGGIAVLKRLFKFRKHLLQGLEPVRITCDDGLRIPGDRIRQAAAFYRQQFDFRCFTQ